MNRFWHTEKVVESDLGELPLYSNLYDLSIPVGINLANIRKTLKAFSGTHDFYHYVV